MFKVNYDFLLAPVYINESIKCVNIRLKYHIVHRYRQLAENNRHSFTIKSSTYNKWPKDNSEKSECHSANLGQIVIRSI